MVRMPTQAPWPSQTLVPPQVVPAGWGGFEQAPLDGSQAPAWWHESVALQTTGLEPAQMPLWQVSVWVQALPSLHALPSVFGGLAHRPVDWSQVPASWH